MGRAAGTGLVRAVSDARRFGSEPANLHQPGLGHIDRR
jgi:hypothetical protein